MVTVVREIKKAHETRVRLKGVYAYVYYTILKVIIVCNYVTHHTNKGNKVPCTNFQLKNGRWVTYCI